MSVLKFSPLSFRSLQHRHYPLFVLSWAFFLLFSCLASLIVLLTISNIDLPPANPMVSYIDTNISAFLSRCHYPDDIPYVFQTSCSLQPRDGIVSVSAYISGCFPLSINYSFHLQNSVSLGHFFVWYGRPVSILRSRRYNSYVWRPTNLMVVAYTPKDNLYSRVSFVSIQRRFPDARCD